MLKRIKKLAICGLVSLFLTGTTNIIAETKDNTTYNTLNLFKSDEYEMSNVLTFNKLIQKYAEDNHISFGKALELFKDSAPMDREQAKYRSFSKTLSVASRNFNPSINFYCQTSEYGWFRGIIKILNTGINADNKHFAGNVFVNLELGDRIFYIVNGDFYEHGTSSVSTGINISMGQFANINLGGSYSSNHFRSIYEESYFRWR